MNPWQITYDTPERFLLLCGIFFIGIAGRYFLFSWLFHAYFYIWDKTRWAARKLGTKPYPSKQFRTEITYSVINAAIFSVVTAATYTLGQKGYTQLYFDINQLPLWYLPISLGISMFIHETYYYWLHRIIHHPSLYRHIHQVHHDSLITSPWTAFSFHPIEGLLEALIIPAIIFVLPMHYSMLVLQLTIMTVSATINHLDIEIYPKGNFGTWFGNNVIGATHHGLHHRQFKFNFGLYFTFWDKWAKTESPLFQKQFDNRSEI
jgi:Delta7-sterol 5-desaturase